MRLPPRITLPIMLLAMVLVGPAVGSASAHGNHHILGHLYLDDNTGRNSLPDGPRPCAIPERRLDVRSLSQTRTTASASGASRRSTTPPTARCRQLDPPRPLPVRCEHRIRLHLQLLNRTRWGTGTPWQHPG
jgi:hypothetical protein